jgi:DNA-binding Lrp family transcriptional regulator
MIGKEEIRILSSLRKNSRQSLLSISRKTSIPQSTVYDKMKKYEIGCIKKYTSILDFPALGFNIRAMVMVRSEDGLNVERYLTESLSVNSLFRLNDRYEFLADCIFCYMAEYKEFIMGLESLRAEKDVFFVIDELKRECFLNMEG